MKIQQFDGGLHTRLKPQFLQLNEATVYNNVDNEKGTLVPVKAKTDEGIITDKFAVFYEAEQEWVSSDIFRDYVEFEKVLYYTDRIGRPQKFDGTNEFNLGITKPSAAPIVTATSAIDSPTEADMIPGSSGNLPSTTHSYLLVNDDGTFLSEPLKLSIDLATARIRLDESINEDSFGKIAFIAERFIITSSVVTRSVLIENVRGLTYGANGVIVYRLFGQKYYKVGSLASDAATLNDTVYDISGNDEFDESEVAPIAGTIQYVYTFYNSADGTESAPSTASAEQDILSSVQLSGLQVSSDPQVDQRRIYRIGGFITTFTLVDTIDNTVTTYLDALADTEVEGTILTATNNVEAPVGLAFLTEAYAMFFGAEGTKLRFTPIGEPNYWSEFFFIQFSTPITGIAPTTNGLIIFTEFNSHLITGTGPTTLSRYPLSGDQGCLDASSIQLISGSAIWASSDGICTSNGSTVTVITKKKLGKISLSPIDSALHDEVYYVLEDTGSILAVDYRYAQVIKRLSLGVEALAVASDVLYGWSSGTQHSLFSSSTFEAFEYTSPRLIEGASTARKMYKKVYISSEGDIIIKVLIDDVLVATKVLASKDNNEMSVPQKLQRGRYIQFEISGTGEVLEIEYVVGRPDGE